MKPEVKEFIAKIDSYEIPIIMDSLDTCIHGNLMRSSIVLSLPNLGGAIDNFQRLVMPKGWNKHNKSCPEDNKKIAKIVKKFFNKEPISFNWLYEEGILKNE